MLSRLRDFNEVNTIENIMKLWVGCGWAPFSYVIYLINYSKFPLNSMEVLVPSGVDDKWNEHVEVLPFAGGIRIAAI